MLYLLLCIIFIVCAWVFCSVCWNFLGLLVFILLAIFSFLFPFLFLKLFFALYAYFMFNFMQRLLLVATKFIAHLANQQVAHEIIALELLIVLLDIHTDDSVEV